MQRIAWLWLVVSSLVLGSVGSLGCRSKPKERATVAVSIFPIYDLVRRIAGPDADVSLALPPGTSPHGWTPPADVAARAAKAKVIVLVGLGLDAWMEPLAPPTARVLKVGDRVPTITTDGAIDGHVWLDPQRARLMITSIADALARADSSHANAFRARATELDAALAALDREIEARMPRCGDCGFVTFHASMGYFAERYHLEVRGVIEKTPHVPPTAPEREALLRTIASHKLRALFREPQLAAAPADELARDAHLVVSVLDPLGGADTETDTYEDLIRFDAAALASVLH